MELFCVGEHPTKTRLNALENGFQWFQCKIYSWPGNYLISGNVSVEVGSVKGLIIDIMGVLFF